MKTKPQMSPELFLVYCAAFVLAEYLKGERPNQSVIELDVVRGQIELINARFQLAEVDLCKV